MDTDSPLISPDKAMLRLDKCDCDKLFACHTFMSTLSLKFQRGRKTGRWLDVGAREWLVNATQQRRRVTSRGLGVFVGHHWRPFRLFCPPVLCNRQAISQQWHSFLKRGSYLNH